MTDEVLKMILEIVEVPILVEQPKTVADRLALIDKALDANGQAVDVALDKKSKTGTQCDINIDQVRTLSAYRKETDPKGFINNNPVLRAGKNESEAARSTRLQLPIGRAASDSIYIIDKYAGHVESITAE